MTDSAQSSVASQGKMSSLLQKTKASFSSGTTPSVSTPSSASTPTPPPVPRVTVPPVAAITPEKTEDAAAGLDLDLLDQALSEVEASVAPAAPQAITQAAAAASLNPAPAATAAGAAKERLDSGATPDSANLDAEQQLGITQVEQERTPELSPEVEAYLQKIQDHQNALPQEVVIADDGQSISTKPALAQPVIVLPITDDVEAAGQHKNPSFSIRWLVEWSRKIMKMFSGKVVYRVADEQELR